MKRTVSTLRLSSRREFIAQALGSAAGLAAMGSLIPRDLRGVAAADPPAPQVRLGFTTYQWGQDWDVPALIANLQRVGIFGVELRTSQKYAHGVEVATGAGQRREVRKRFADSPIRLVGIASGERLDWPEPEKLEAAIQSIQQHIRLSRDVGASGVRVFPNQWHPNVPRETTMAQIARALDRIGLFAAEHGQEVRLEAHGPAGQLQTLRTIMDQVTSPAVRLMLNSDARDTQDPGFEANFNQVKHLLARALHLHNLKDSRFPYQLQLDLLRRNRWDGWALLELSDRVTDRIAGLIEQREIWDAMMAKSA